MLFMPDRHRHPLIDVLRRILAWRQPQRRIDIRELNRHLRADIGAPD